MAKISIFLNIYGLFDFFEPGGGFLDDQKAIKLYFMCGTIGEPGRDVL